MAKGLGLEGINNTQERGEIEEYSVPLKKNEFDHYNFHMRTGHIPTAAAFPLIYYSDTTTNLFMSLPKEKKFREIAQELDLRINDTFVCYDTSKRSFNVACRLAWTLKGFGAKNVHVLNGNLHNW